jgi:hypothetical protein
VVEVAFVETVAVSGEVWSPCWMLSVSTADVDSFADFGAWDLLPDAVATPATEPASASTAPPVTRIFEIFFMCVTSFHPSASTIGRGT